MVPSVASSIALAFQTERAISRLRHLLEVRRKLLAERKVQMARWRALLATSRILVTQPTPAPLCMVQTRRLRMHVAGRPDDRGRSSDIERLPGPNDAEQPTRHRAMHEGPALLQRTSGLQ